MVLEIGDRVRWQVGGRTYEGEVRDIYLRDLRSGNPFQIGRGRALLIELNDGRKVLKLEDELAPIAQKRFG